jgi:hypothetical protein
LFNCPAVNILFFDVIHPQSWRIIIASSSSSDPRKTTSSSSSSSSL